MVIYGLTVIILETTRSNTAVSILILTFLGPAVLFSAVAGVYVDRLDKRVVLVVTNVLRSLAFVALFLVGGNLPLILVLNVVISTITVFFGPAEAAMIPQLVPRRQLISANGVFTLTLNAAFAIGFALLGPIVVTHHGRPGADHGRRGLLPDRGRVLLDAAGRAAGDRIRPPAHDTTPKRRWARSSSSCARASRSSARRPRSSGRCCTSASRHRWSASSASSAPTSPATRSASSPRTSSSSSCRSASAS